MSKELRAPDVIADLRADQRLDSATGSGEATAEQMTALVEQILARGPSRLPNQEQLEAFFGEPLDAIGVYYADPALLAQLGAVAVTIGPNVCLPRGGAPDEVVVHEVTHALQVGTSQGAVTPSSITGTSQPSDATEQEAAEMQRRFRQARRADLAERMPSDRAARAGGEAIGQVTESADPRRVHRKCCGSSRTLGDLNMTPIRPPDMEVVEPPAMDFVYRWDNRPPDVIGGSGFRPRPSEAYDDSLAGHVRRGATGDSPWVSTGKIGLLTPRAEASQGFYNFNYLYKIDYAQAANDTKANQHEVADVNASFDKYNRERTEGQREEINPFAHQVEVAFQFGVTASAITHYADGALARQAIEDRRSQDPNAIIRDRDIPWQAMPTD